MKKYVNNQRGFTLVELMIVIVIVGILAAVAVPIYQANVKKAKMSECDAALGTIRTALRVYYAANSHYPNVTAGTQVTLVPGLDISAADLDGRYFDAPNYTLTSDSSSNTYTIKCDNADIFGNNPRTLNHLGEFSGGL